MASTEPVRVELWFDSDCPNAAIVRERLEECLPALRARWTLQEFRDAGRLSPTVLVDGVDVAQGASLSAVGCRVDLVTVEQIRQALHEAEERRRSND
ncbi:alkylmercury lyase [Nocardioides antri]|uniref:Alkylmercury lyase n=1 Tax=Nocardioides antri TaxID=2607659 RepID=A0A5B1M8J9_9ACTN|nr:alkylmercury lyase [Nocardioides antri]KAA1428776.1 alkylmercury lyase [Nocardioides antri]